MTQVLSNNTNGAYTFSSQPRALQQRKKYKEVVQNEQEYQMYGNIMYDRRVIRGNTYALHTLPASAQPDPIEIQREQEARRRALARKRAKEQLKPRTPDPVDGRKNTHVQTELYLEELSDRIEEVDVDVQTDAFLDRPPSPLFIPAKTGTDKETQIFAGDLFDFDIEVKPILEVLIGKTIEQSLLEVMEEEELANLRRQQREFEEIRNTEKVEQQRLEEQERRLREEKQRRMKQANEILKLEKETAEKLAAKAFAKSYLTDLVPSVFNNLKSNGYFYDPVQRDVEVGFMPYIMELTANELDQAELGRLLLDELIKEVVTKREFDYEKLEKTLAELKSKEEAKNTQSIVNEGTNIVLDVPNVHKAAEAVADLSDNSNEVPKEADDDQKGDNQGEDASDVQ